jgi:hypothetical protein
MPALVAGIHAFTPLPQRFDQKIQRDVQSGKLDRLADHAIDDPRKGRARQFAP